jgi:hypothetical protein
MSIYTTPAFVLQEWCMDANGACMMTKYAVPKKNKKGHSATVNNYSYIRITINFVYRRRDMQ